MTITAEYNQRQYQLMAKFLDEVDYSNVEGLGQLVDSLSALVEALEEPDEVWERKFHTRGTLEHNLRRCYS